MIVDVCLYPCASAWGCVCVINYTTAIPSSEYYRKLENLKQKYNSKECFPPNCPTIGSRIMAPAVPYSRSLYRKLFFLCRTFSKYSNYSFSHIANPLVSTTSCSSPGTVQYLDFAHPSKFTTCTTDFVVACFQSIWELLFGM